MNNENGCGLARLQIYKSPPPPFESSRYASVHAHTKYTIKLLTNTHNSNVFTVTTVIGSFISTLLQTGLIPGTHDIIQQDCGLALSKGSATTGNGTYSNNYRAQKDRVNVVQTEQLQT